MAGSRYEYVKLFESDERLLPGCWVVIRLDGRAFTKFAKLHDFDKPNDVAALRLCNAAAATVLTEFDEHVAFGYGQSDEYSFVLRRESTLFNRRKAKILSTVVSLFSSAYVSLWPVFLTGRPLKCTPSFDARTVCYPTTKHLRDYLSWRQADVHVNNLFNTTFWALVLHGGMTTTEAERALKGTLAKDKHEILFSRFAINYNDQPPMFKKGSFITKLCHINATEQHHHVLSPTDPHSQAPTPSTVITNEHPTPAAPECKSSTSQGDTRPDETEVETKAANRTDSVVVAIHDDIIADKFWERNPDLLGKSDLDPPRIRKI